MRLIAVPATRAVAICAVVLASPLSPSAAAPQHRSSALPSRIDNIWGGRDHQPTEAEVRSRAPHDPATLQVQGQADDEVELLYQQLMSQSADMSPPRG
jgi:hypothetical protein